MLGVGGGAGEYLHGVGELGEDVRQAGGRAGTVHRQVPAARAVGQLHAAGLLQRLLNRSGREQQVPRGLLPRLTSGLLLLIRHQSWSNLLCLPLPSLHTVLQPGLLQPAVGGLLDRLVGRGGGGQLDQRVPAAVPGQAQQVCRLHHLQYSTCSYKGVILAALPSQSAPAPGISPPSPRTAGRTCGRPRGSC